MYRIGIDLGGTNIVAGVVDEQYNILAKASVKTALPRPSEEIAASMAEVAKEAAAKAGITLNDVAHIGVGSPGTCDPLTGIVEYANNLGFRGFHLGESLQNLLGKPICLENDANAAAYGEFIAGAGRGSKDCVCITLGTGVGGGVIIDGKIYSGFNFSGGELGHMVIVTKGEPCTCGRNGCWEAYSSSTALIRQTKRAMENDPSSAMWKMVSSIDKVSGRTAFDAMRAGDSKAKAVVDDYIEYLACGCANIINIFQPEILCIGGGICNEGESLLKALKSAIGNELYSRYLPKQTEIVIAQLGSDAGVIGAAFLDTLR